MSIMPGRIFSTLNLSLYPVVYFSRELKKYFATPLRSPLPIYCNTWWGKFTFLTEIYRHKANAFTLIKGNMGNRPPVGSQRGGKYI
jgi:hypothetical protein